MTRFNRLRLALALCWLTASARAEYPAERVPSMSGVPEESAFTIYPDRLKQVIKGFGFEIQSDSIASDNLKLPEATTSVPHDLLPAERARFYREMLQGFRYCRLAGGLYWRGVDPSQKFLQGRWPEQAAELREMIQVAGIEGVAFEYWSPAPFWKANRKYTGADGSENVLRCFGKTFANDPQYRGNTALFLQDFAGACRRDLETLRANGIPIAMWGLQNEPPADCAYSSCKFTPAQYSEAFLVAAAQVRAFDPRISIVADTAFGWDFKFIRPVLDNPDTAGLLDDLVIHHIGSDASEVLQIPEEKSGKPRFQNEFEYLHGPASPARCLNTVQHIMNWFQVGEAPTWFWIHALKPVGHAEASGYALGFWRPPGDTNTTASLRYPGLKPGGWTWNPYNWNAVGSFVRHMPWDCRAVAIQEGLVENDLRAFAFKRPDGKLTIVVSNRSFREHTYRIATGLCDATFKGFRYTPEEAGKNCMGVQIGALKGGTISTRVPDLAWEFWEQQ